MCVFKCCVKHAFQPELKCPFRPTEEGVHIVTSSQSASYTDQDEVKPQDKMK